jgi:hypothetical protein
MVAPAAVDFGNSASRWRRRERSTSFIESSRTPRKCPRCPTAAKAVGSVRKQGLALGPIALFGDGEVQPESVTATRVSITTLESKPDQTR